MYVFRLSPGTIGICTTPTVSRLTSVRAQLAGLLWRSPDLTGHIRRSDSVRFCACARLGVSRFCVCCVFQGAGGVCIALQPGLFVFHTSVRCLFNRLFGWLVCVCFVVAWDASNIMVLILIARLIDFLLFNIKGICLDKKSSKKRQISHFLFFLKTV